MNEWTNISDSTSWFASLQPSGSHVLLIRYSSRPLTYFFMMYRGQTDAASLAPLPGTTTVYYLRSEGLRWLTLSKQVFQYHVPRNLCSASHLCHSEVILTKLQTFSSQWCQLWWFVLRVPWLFSKHPEPQLYDKQRWQTSSVSWLLHQQTVPHFLPFCSDFPLLET